MAFDVEAAFGELRSLVHGAPSVRAFSAVCRLAQEVEEAAPGVFADRMLDYARGELASWPTRCVTLSVHYEDGGAFSRMAWAPLARGVVVTKESWHDYTHADYVRCVRAAAGREHVALDRFRVTGEQLVGFVADGLLDGFRSVELREIDLTGSLGALCEALASREGTQGLDALRLVGCRWGGGDLDALSTSRLAGRLRALGLSRTPWPGWSWSAGLRRFGRLERLELTELGLTEVEAIALSLASAPDTLRHVNLGGNHLESAAIEAWVAAGRVGWWLDRDGPVALDTSAFRFDASALTACADAGLFDEVESWRGGPKQGDGTHAAWFETWAPLRDRPQALRRLRGLHMRCVRMSARLYDEVLEALERAPLGAACVCPPSDAAFARTLEAPWAARADTLRLSGYPNVHGERALRALLAWERLETIGVLGVRFEVDAGPPALEAARAPEVFLVLGRGERRVVQTRRTSRHLGHDVCVDVDGSVRGNWLRRWERASRAPGAGTP